MNVNQIYEESVSYGGEWLLFATGKLELTETVFLNALNIAIRHYNRQCPCDKEVDIKTGGYSYTFQGEIPDWIANVIPVAIAGLVPPIAYDLFAFEYNKQFFVWKYRKPILYMQYPGTFNVRGVYKYVLTTVPAKTALAGKTGIAVNFPVNSDMDTIATAIAAKLNSMTGIFSAISSTNKVIITNLADGVVPPATLGDTGWSVAPVITPGINDIAEVSEFTCEADVAGSLDGEYFEFSSPAFDYYAWFAVHDEWLASTAILLNEVRVPTAAEYTGLCYRATDIGGAPHHTDTVEPVWPTTVGNTIIDGDITWTCVNCNTVSTDPSIIGRTGVPTPLKTNGTASDVAAALTSSIGTLNTIFGTTQIATVLRITNLIAGAVLNIPTMGNTGWATPINVVIPGSYGTGTITQIQCFADLSRSLFLKYLTINTPTTSYYIYFTIDGEGDDPINDSSYIFNMDTDKRDFFMLCAGLFLQMLGTSRSSFDIANLEIKHNGAGMLSRGNELFKQATDGMKETAKYRLTW